MGESGPASNSGKLLSQFHDDPEMRDLLELFLSELPERLGQLTQALEAQDVSTMRVLAHQLKGACGGYGFPQISVAAGVVESSAKASTPDVGALAASVRELLELCNRAL